MFLRVSFREPKFIQTFEDRMRIALERDVTLAGRNFLDTVLGPRALVPFAESNPSSGVSPANVSTVDYLHERRDPRGTER